MSRLPTADSPVSGNLSNVDQWELRMEGRKSERRMSRQPESDRCSVCATSLGLEKKKSGRACRSGSSLLLFIPPLRCCGSSLHFLCSTKVAVHCFLPLPFSWRPGVCLSGSASYWMFDERLLHAFLFLFLFFFFFFLLFECVRKPLGFFPKIWCSCSVSASSEPLCKTSALHFPHPPSPPFLPLNTCWWVTLRRAEGSSPVLLSLKLRLRLYGVPSPCRQFG